MGRWVSPGPTSCFSSLRKLLTAVVQPWFPRVKCLWYTYEFRLSDSSWTSRSPFLYTWVGVTIKLLVDGAFSFFLYLSRGAVCASLSAHDATVAVSHYVFWRWFCCAGGFKMGAGSARTAMTVMVASDTCSQSWFPRNIVPRGVLRYCNYEPSRRRWPPVSTAQSVRPSLHHKNLCQLCQPLLFFSFFFQVMIPTAN